MIYLVCFLLTPRMRPYSCSHCSVNMWSLLVFLFGQVTSNVAQALPRFSFRRKKEVVYLVTRKIILTIVEYILQPGSMNWVKPSGNKLLTLSHTVMSAVIKALFAVFIPFVSFRNSLVHWDIDDEEVRRLSLRNELNARSLARAAAVSFALFCLSLLPSCPFHGAAPLLSFGVIRSKQSFRSLILLLSIRSSSRCCNVIFICLNKL